jgi:GNAT superfamily N-acetyltransferase
MRPLSLTDYNRGHLSVLSVLTETPDVGPEAWETRFKDLRETTRTYYIVVVVSRETDRIVASGGVFIERKFLRGLGNVGHIEDIAVSREMQGKKLGLRIIQALTHISEGVGCYKTILNCSDTNIRAFMVFVARAGCIADSCRPSQRSMRSAVSRNGKMKWWAPFGRCRCVLAHLFIGQVCRWAGPYTEALILHQYPLDSLLACYNGLLTCMDLDFST